MARQAFTMRLETERFNRHIKSLVTKYPGKTDVILKKFALDLLKRIVMKSPVDTGRFRAAWYPSMRGLGGEFSFGSSAEVAEGKAQGGYRENLHGSKRWVELINGVKYAIYLEYGYSMQAPYGTVRVSMREMTGDKLPLELGDELQKEWKRHY